MSDIKKTAVVAVYDSHDLAEKSVKKLTDANIPIKEISIIGRGFHTDEKVVGFYNVGDRMKVWGKNGAFWGGMWGLLAGGMFITAPVIGPIFVVGSFATIVLTALEGAAIVGTASVLTAALVSIGIPKDTILQYEQAIKADGFVVLVQGTQEETQRARDILKTCKAKQVDMHSCGCADMKKVS